MSSVDPRLSTKPLLANAKSKSNLEVDLEQQSTQPVGRSDSDGESAGAVADSAAVLAYDGDILAGFLWLSDEPESIVSDWEARGLRVEFRNEDDALALWNGEACTTPASTCLA